MTPPTHRWGRGGSRRLPLREAGGPPKPRVHRGRVERDPDIGRQLGLAGDGSTFLGPGVAGDGRRDPTPEGHRRRVVVLEGDLPRPGVLGELLAQHPAPWQVAFQDDNTAAVTFWRRVATAVAGDAWTEERRPVPGKAELPPDIWISFDAPTVNARFRRAAGLTQREPP